jgi:hypothetical protein
MNKPAQTYDPLAELIVTLATMQQAVDQARLVKPRPS